MMFLCGLVGLLAIALAIAAMFGILYGLGVLVSLLFERRMPYDPSDALLLGTIGLLVLLTGGALFALGSEIGCMLVKHFLGR